jgi:hypothetical protein
MKIVVRAKAADDIDNIFPGSLKTTQLRLAASFCAFSTE